MQFTLTEMWGHMGIFARGIVIVMAIMSVLSLVTMAERWVVFSRSRSESRSFAAFSNSSRAAACSANACAGMHCGAGGH